MKWSYTATVYFILFTFSAGIAPGQHQRHGERARAFLDGRRGYRFATRSGLIANVSHG